MNIWVLTGTKEGSEIIKLLKKNFRIIASAATKYGMQLAKGAGADEVVCSLDLKGMKKLIKEKNIAKVIDATHPFAIEASKNAIRACKKLDIPYLRFERKFAKIPKNKLVHFAENFQDAAKKAAQLGNVIFYAAGSKNIETFSKFANGKKKEIVTRVLPDRESIEKCLKAGIKPENIIAMQGPFTKALNKALMKEYDAQVLVTKESGEAGGVEAKIKAAIELKIPAVVIKRPKMSYPKTASEYSGIARWLKNAET